MVSPKGMKASEVIFNIKKKDYGTIKSFSFLFWAIYSNELAKPWRDGPAVQSMHYFGRGCEFGSQQPQQVTNNLCLQARALTGTSLGLWKHLHSCAHFHTQP